MKHYLYLSLLCLCMSSCGKDAGKTTSPNEKGMTVLQQQPAGETGKQVKPWTRGAMQEHRFRDIRTGLVVASTQYPSEWNVISKPIYTIDQKLPTFLVQVTGPGNLKSFNTPTTYHVNYQDPQMSSWMNNSPYARLLRPLVSPQQLFEEEVKERMQKSGFVYLGKRQQPRILNTMRAHIASKINIPANVSLYSTEWRNDSGEKALVGITQVSLQQPTISGYMMTWYYTIHYTIVNEDAYEEAVLAMEDAVVNYRESDAWQNYVAHLRQHRARVNEERMLAAARDHNRRMDSRWASFNAHQERMKSLSLAQDANHAAFMDRNFGSGSDRGHRDFLNMINEEETVYNPLDGKNYQVNAGSKEYWMDADGNYIRNDDLFYTPNGDINLNQREWVKVRSKY